MSASAILNSPSSTTSPQVFRNLEGEPSSDCFLPTSPAMVKIERQIARLAVVCVPVLLLGESGVGKEVVARRIHKLSPRAHRCFLKVNCAALPADLLESELFGYEAGAFTGATKSKPGLFEVGHQGTILLDEIGEVPPALQAKLLQVLQDCQFCRLGGRSLVTVDVRIMAATNVHIEQALESKKLREDLYYRLSAFTIRIPPLRERGEEIVPLLNHFLQHWAIRLGCRVRPFSPRVVESCLAYSWPGNVRQLENLVKRHLILGDEEELPGKNGNGNGKFKFKDLSSVVGINRCSDLKSIVRGLKAEAETEAIKQALQQCNGNRNEAARSLNICGKTLLHKLRQYRIV